MWLSWHYNVLLSFVFLQIIVKLSAIYIEEYSWRDYHGVIPFDALEAGLTKDKEPIYLGQVLFENKIIPGKIYKGDDNIYFEFGAGEHSAIENVKIFCTPHPSSFEWIHTTNNDTLFLTNKIIVNGGHEPGYFTYLGRAPVDAELYPGKVICTADSCLGLFTTRKNSMLHLTYEILTYNPAMQSSNKKCSSDLYINFFQA